MRRSSRRLGRDEDGYPEDCIDEGGDDRCNCKSNEPRPRWVRFDPAPDGLLLVRPQELSLSVREGEVDEHQPAQVPVLECLGGLDMRLQFAGLCPDPLVPAIFVMEKADLEVPLPEGADQIAESRGVLRGDRRGRDLRRRAQSLAPDEPVAPPG